MSARRQIIFYAQRGTGKSPTTRGPEDLTVDDMVRDLEALRRHLKVENMASKEAARRIIANRRLCP